VKKNFDYVIIGAGSSGCVIAARLTENPNVHVLLLEAGSPDSNPNIHIPANAWQVWMTENDWWYPTVPQSAAANRTIYWPRGKTLGGSSSLNAMIYIRGNRTDYDAWAYQGCAGWDYESLLPFFKKSEDYHGGENQFHGAEGPLTVSRITDPNPLTVAFIHAANEAGHALNHDFAGENTLGVGLCDLTVRAGQRWSTAAAFLRPALSRSNLIAITGARAQRLMFEKDRCVGLEYLKDDRLEQVSAKEVIVCAGAVASPELLLRSGIGNANDLEKLGIEVISDLPGVGQNLQDHLLSFVICEAKKPIPSPKYNVLEAHYFAKSDPRLLGPDYQPLFMHNAPPLPTLEIPTNSYALAPGLIRPKSRGEIKLNSADQNVPLHIDPRYLSQTDDLNCLVYAFQESLEIMNSEAMGDWRARTVHPGKTDRKSLERYIRETCETYHHQTSTCKMGLDAMSVVEPNTLRVYGVEGLRVADASIMPNVVSGNTNAPAIMIGEKAANLIQNA
jgi:choline dehydrogenase